VTVLKTRSSGSLQILETMAPPELPTWIGELRLAGVPAFDRQWDVRLEQGRVRVETV
jgi:hypothetical protein